MRRRIGYFGILLSYILFIFIGVFFGSIDPNADKLLLAICLVGTLTLLFVSLALTYTRYEIAPKESKLDEWLRKLSFFPALLVITPLCFLISANMILIDFAVNNFRKKIKALQKEGFSYSKTKKNGKTTYRLRKGDCIVKIIPEESYEISFDGGESFETIADSVLGTKEEREELKRVIFEYNNCDYRDRDLYDVTRAHVHFLLNNIKALEAQAFNG